MTLDLDDRVIKARFDVWISRPMTFNNPPGQNIKTYSIYTKAEKVPYTKYMLDSMERMLKMPNFGSSSGDPVAIKLDGMIRYVWRSDVLTEAQFDEIKKRQSDKLRLLRRKPKGDVGSCPAPGDGV